MASIIYYFITKKYTFQIVQKIFLVTLLGTTSLLPVFRITRVQNFQIILNFMGFYG